MVYALVTYRLSRFLYRQQQAQYDERDGDDAEPPRNAARAYHYCPRDCAPACIRAPATDAMDSPVRRSGTRSLSLRVSPARSRSLRPWNARRLEPALGCPKLTAPERREMNAYDHCLERVGRDCRRLGPENGTAADGETIEKKFIRNGPPCRSAVVAAARATWRAPRSSSLSCRPRPNADDRRRRRRRPRYRTTPRRRRSNETGRVEKSKTAPHVPPSGLRPIRRKPF